MPGQGIPLGDILADSGYAHRDAAAWAIPLRRAGARLVQVLHQPRPGPKGAHHGAIIANGSLYCPATPRALLELPPPGPGATGEQAAAHDAKTAEAARHKLGRITADDEDGYHRVQCPAAMGKIRCPLRPASIPFPADPQVSSIAPARDRGLLVVLEHRFHSLAEGRQFDPAPDHQPALAVSMRL